MPKPIFVSFFTDDEPYRTTVKRLEKSLISLKADFYIEKINSVESWIEVASKKASFILQMMEQERRPVCWIDADAKLLNIPHYLNSFEYDFAVMRREGWNFWSAQVVFGNTESAKKILQRWLDYSQNFPYIFDQATLGYAFWDVSLETDVNSFWIPEESAVKRKYFFDERLYSLKSKVNSGIPTFYQHQSSREAKSSLSKRSSVEFNSMDLPLWWRMAMQKMDLFPLTDHQKIEIGIQGEKYRRKTPNVS
jgi:hypothetical protein